MGEGRRDCKMFSLQVKRKKREPKLCEFSKKSKSCMPAGAHLFVVVRKSGKTGGKMIYTLKKE